MRTELFLIGGSSGSLNVLYEVLPKLNKNISFPIVIILHREHLGDNTSQLKKVLQYYTDLKIYDAEEHMILEESCIYIAPTNEHLVFGNNKRLLIVYSEYVNFCRPSIDVAFKTAAEIYKESVTALLLSGANTDGVDGLNYINSENGITLVQAPETAQVDIMPLKAIENVKINFILKPTEIANFINELSRYNKL